MKRILALLGVVSICILLTMCGGGAGGPTNTGDTNPADYFTLSVVGSPLNVNIGGGGRGGSQDVLIKMAPVGDYTGTVILLAPTGLPIGVTASYATAGNGDTCNLTATAPCELVFLAGSGASAGTTATITIPADGYRLRGTSVTVTINIKPSLTQTASILYMTPNAGEINSIVTVIGSGFGATQGQSTLNFTLQYPMTTTIQSWSDNKIVAVVPSSAITGAANVTVGNVQSNTVNFTLGNASSLSYQGQWSTLATTMPFTTTQSATWGTVMSGLNPIHMALLHTNQILMVGGSQNCPPPTTGCAAQDNYPLGAGIFDLASQKINPIALNKDWFCNGMSIMPDGRVLLSGGTKAYGQLAPVGQGGGLLPFLGLPDSAIFDPTQVNDGFQVNPPTAGGRWYPTVTELGNGSMMSTSGLLDTYGTAATNYNNTNNTSEIWNGAAWSNPIPLASVYPQSTQQMIFFLYPRLHLLPTGHLFMSEPDSATMDFNPNTNTWSFVTWTLFPCSGPQTDCNAGSVGDRTYGTSVLLPMTPANGYDPTVMIMGGDNPATYTTELIDFNPNGNFFNNPVLGQQKCTYSAFCFVEGPPMIQARVEMEGTILPNGQVLVDSGSSQDEEVGTASLKAELYTPANPTGIGSFKQVASNTIDRYYHNTQLLLPDGTVLLAGSNPGQGTFEPRMENFTPPYLFAADGTAALRPTITTAPTSMTYGKNFTIQTGNSANDITAVALLKAGSVTHSFDMDQRYVGLSFTQSNGVLTVSTSAINSNLAPPGYYMLYVVNAAGVPSLSKWIQVGGNPAAVANVEFHAERAVTPGWLIKRMQVTENPLSKHGHMMMQRKEAAPAQH